MNLLITQVSIPDALLMSMLGLAIVFFALMLLMGMIGILSSVMGKLAKPAPAAEAAVSAPKAVSSAPGSCGGIKLNNVSERQAAMIMAIVADELKAPLNTLRFKSIVELD